MYNDFSYSSIPPSEEEEEEEEEATDITLPSASLLPFRV